MWSGVVTQEMAQYVNALIRENEQKSMRIESLVKEYQVQSGVLRQQQMGQQVLAEVLKMMMADDVKNSSDIKALREQVQL